VGGGSAAGAGATSCTILGGSGAAYCLAAQPPRVIETITIPAMLNRIMATYLPNVVWSSSSAVQSN
jgi:hypothetical protein